MGTIHQTFLALWYVLLAWNLLCAMALFAAGERKRGLRNLGWAVVAVFVILGLNLLSPCLQPVAPEKGEAARAEAARKNPAAAPTLPVAGKQQEAAGPNARPPKPTHGASETREERPAGAAAVRGPSLWGTMLKLIDSLGYLLLTLSPLLSIVAGFLLLIGRRRAIRSGRAVLEKRIYMVVMVGGMVVWLWNGLRPTPIIFEDRFGLYWGWKAENMDATVFTPVDPAEKTAYRGDTSLKVTFRRQKGWFILHHFPMPPAVDKYSELEFYIRKTDLKHDRLLVCLYGDGKQQYPTADGVEVTDEMLSVADDDREWRCVRLKLEDFRLPDRCIIGIGIGKADGADSGVFYLDCIRLIPKQH